MKLKQSVLIMMAATLPLVSFAASEIPVTKDTATVQAAQADTNKVNRNDLTYRISSTATPEQNRALRSVASKVDRDAVEVVAPNADRYMDRKEVAVSLVTGISLAAKDTTGNAAAIMMSTDCFNFIV